MFGKKQEVKKHSAWSIFGPYQRGPGGVPDRSPIQDKSSGCEVKRHNTRLLRLVVRGHIQREVDRPPFGTKYAS
jgi:hypothetical protein